MAEQLGFGIDIGGSGIKGAYVNLLSGEFATDRYRIPTPQPATPEAVAAAVKKLVDRFDVPASVPIGIDFPAPILHGVAPMIANLDPEWKDRDVLSLFSGYLDRPVFVVNDADAAGFAEVHYGAASGYDGLVIVLTLGTGIGSVLVMDGVLVPNTELGHLELDGRDAETHASSGVFERENLGWRRWASRLQRYFSHLEMLFSPDVFIVGGGISKKADRFLPLIETRAPIVPAELRNTAGIVGSALLAAVDAGTFTLDRETKKAIKKARKQIRSDKKNLKKAKKSKKSE